MNTDTAVKHTPGPWIVHQFPSGNIEIFGPNDEAIAAIWHKHADNATLIASAPTLLAALKAVTATYRTFRNVPRDEQEWTTLDDEALDAAFEAIQQAEGA